MKKLIIYYGESLQVEGFSKDCKRSCEGSLHILSRKYKTVTDDEYEHILKEYPWMKSKLKVISEIGAADPRNKKAETKKPAKKTPDKKAADASAEKTKPSTGDTQEEEKPKDKSQSKDKDKDKDKDKPSGTRNRR